MQHHPSPIRTAVLTAMLGACALIGTPAKAETLRFMHFVSPESANPKHFMGPWAKDVAEMSRGRLTVEIFPFMQLGGKATEMYDLIRDGAVDGGWVIPSYQPGRFPEAEPLELPFMTGKSAERASLAAWDYTQRHLMDDFSDIHVIAVHMHGPGLIHKKGPPILALADFRGLKLRGPSRAATLLLEGLGAIGVGMPVPAFPEALSKGVVDGGAITWEQAPSLKLDELTDSHSDVFGDRALYNLYFLWAMNKQRYEGLAPEDRAIIDGLSGRDASARAGRAHDVGDAEGRAAMLRSGNAVAEIPEDVTAAMRTIGDRVVAEWVREATAKGLDGAGLVADARRAVEETR